MVIILTLLIVFFVGFLVKTVLSSSSDSNAVHGKVIKMDKKANSTNKNSIRYSYVDVKITSGNMKGKIITVQNSVSGNISDESSNTQNFANVGDQVLVNLDHYKAGDSKTAYIYEIVRYRYLYELGAAFILLLIIIGGLKGLKSVITLAITGFCIIKVLIPLIMHGFNPITVSVVLCIFLTVINLTIIGGRNNKTLAAIIGTCGGVVIAGVIAIFSNKILRITGLTDDEMQTIIYTVNNSSFNFSGLLFAEIIMGALGAVMDTGVSIASSISEIKFAKHDMSMKELFNSGMNVGKDIMGSMCNTLILAYVGGAMYLMIMITSSAYTSSISNAINQDIIAAEVLKALSGSIGLILAIPITSFAAAFLMTRKKKKDKEYTKEETQDKVDILYNKVKNMFSLNRKSKK